MNNSLGPGRWFRLPDHKNSVKILRDENFPFFFFLMKNIFSHFTFAI